MKDKLLVIVGPTASGKTSLAIEVAKKYNGEIICADSRTIYKGMDIGTAKPSKAEQQEITHHLLDIIEPGEVFSAADFKKACAEAVKDIRERGKLAIVVGGSGLYIDAYLFDYQFRNSQPIVDVSEMNREQILELAKKTYPEEMNNIDVNNIQRLTQLLERGPVDKSDTKKLKIKCKIIGLNPEKLMLKQNIAKRTRQMLNNSFVQEVEALRKKYGKDCPSLQTIGYKQVGAMLDGQIKLNDVETTINSATQDLAKRQITWFKRNKAITWVINPTEALSIAKQYLESI
jgi:tRNA dimethylallyltransferase